MSHPPGRAALAVVTGASSGIGAALAREISRGGRPVLAVARREDRLRALAAEARAAGQAAVHPLPLDLTAPGAAETLRAAARELGGASWLVNCAGFGMYGPFERADPARLGEMIRLNCEALVLATRALLPDLREAGPDAALLNVASLGGLQPMPFLSVYGATKAFVVSFTEALAEELRGTGVRVTAFCPGPVETEFGAVAGTGARFADVPGILAADRAARDALAALGRGTVVSVPGGLNRVMAGLGRVLPRGLLRRVSRRVLAPREGA
ncbi:MAG TPA: SDR family NAD(P)-dependent oxidoreductase [Anaeromyxobacteraceae bacterium]|nr:SDR family NAD(P)-dependent oxidoreductase [Anaeromyxobacteraceae bacterium]